MANGFKLTGGSYVAKWGNNGNSGNVDSAPKQTIAQGLSVGTGTCVVLSGIYNEAISPSRVIIGDGIVKILGTTLNNCTIYQTASNFYFENFSNIYIGNDKSNIIFRNIQNLRGDANTNISDCIFINVTKTQSAGYSFVLTRCLFFNYSDLNILATYIDCYLDTSCDIRFVPTLNRCNIRGKVTIVGVSYACPQAVDLAGVIAGTLAFGSAAGSYPSGCTNWLHVGLSQTATQCYVTNGNFNADPQFLDVFNEDFTVLPTSPMIGKGTSGTNIGGVKVTNTSLRRTATQGSSSNLSGTTDLSVEPSNLTGEWVSGVITIDALNPRVFQRPTYVGNLSFDSASAGNVANVNDNVPWVGSYTKNNAVRNNTISTSPLVYGTRPCILVRFSNKSSMPNPALDSDWDNGNNNTTTVNGILPGEYFLAELNVDFKYDAIGFGNADVNFNPVVNSQIAAKYCMYKVILTDKYPTV
jgi:hypothetical protein